MESATITKVTLRKEKLRSGKLSLYLDYYPPIWNPHIKKMSRREFLGLYLFGNPKDKFELDYNEEIMLKARGIRATRELCGISGQLLNTGLTVKFGVKSGLYHTQGQRTTLHHGFRPFHTFVLKPVESHHPVHHSQSKTKQDNS